MSKTILTGLLACGLLACGHGAQNTASDSLALSQPDSAVPRDRSLARGTRIDATMQNALSSRTNTAGETVQATVSSDVMDDRGSVAIPAGATVGLTIAQLEPTGDHTGANGQLSLVVTSVTVNDRAYTVSADLEPVAHHLEGRGVTGDVAAKVGAGALIGAVAGRLIGKDTRGAVVGGAVGAVAGTAVAVDGARRDVVVSAGTPIVFALTRSLTISM